AGRPQFDTEGIALTLAPEEVVQEFRKEIRDLKKRGVMVDEAKVKQKHYNRAKTEARAKKEVFWDAEVHKKLVAGEPAALVSKTQMPAEQILAIGLPDLAEESLPGEAMLAEEKQKAIEEAKARGEEVKEEVPLERPPMSAPEEAPHRRLNIRTVID